MDIRQALNSDITGINVSLNGWVRTKRGSKNVSFIALNDGTTIYNIQIVIEGTHFDDVLKNINTGTSINVKGKLVISSGVGQAIEILAQSIKVLGYADPKDYPLQPKKHSLEFLRENAHLRFRTNTFGAVFRIRHAMSFAVHQMI